MFRRIAIILSVILLAGILTAFLVLRQIVFGGTPTVHPRHAPPLAVTPCATINLPNGARSFQVVSQDSIASYEASFQAAGQSLPGSVMGVTGDVSGQFLLTQDEHIQSLEIVVDLRTLDSGSPDRDNHVRNDTFETDKYPYATFRVTDAAVLSGNYAEGQNLSFKLDGQLTLHGITRPEVFAMQGKLVGNTITGTASTLIHLQDFRMKPPQTTSVVTITVSNAVTLSINFTAKKQTCNH
jgi:polyisoprenoid-binding protein YceI